MPWLLLVPTVGNKSVTPSKEKPDMVVSHHHLLHLQTQQTREKEKTLSSDSIGSLWSGLNHQPFPVQYDLASFFTPFFFRFKECQGVKESCVALVHSVTCFVFVLIFPFHFFCFLFYCNVFLSDMPMAAGELIRAFLSPGMRGHSVGICGTFVIYTCQMAKDTGSGLSCRQSSACDCTYLVYHK